MAKRHIVALTDDERAALERREAGPLTRRQRYRVQVLLRSDAGDTDEEIADGLGIAAGTVANVRRRFTLGGIEAAIEEMPRPGARPILDGKAEANRRRTLAAVPTETPASSAISSSVSPASARSRIWAR